MIAAGRRSKCSATRASIRSTSIASVPKHSTVTETGVRDADRVGDLELAAVGEAGGDEVLRDVARRVRGRAVDLRRILAREAATALPRGAAVRVDDDLAAGEPRVGLRAADDELPRRVDEHEPVLAQPGLVVELARQDRVQHVLDDVGLHAPVDVDAVGVLRDDEQPVDLDRPRAAVLVLLVAHGDHRLAVGAQVLERARLSHLGQPAADRVRERDRQRHQLRRLAARVAEHHSLVAGADPVQRVVGGVVGLVDAAGDVR